jgi:hypothetical protein
VIVIPVAFVSDHSETLWEINIETRQEAKRLGIGYFDMSPALNTSPDYIAALRDLVLKSVNDCDRTGGRHCRRCGHLRAHGRVFSPPGRPERHRPGSRRRARGDDADDQGRGVDGGDRPEQRARNHPAVRRDVRRTRHRRGTVVRRPPGRPPVHSQGRGPPSPPDVAGGVPRVVALVHGGETAAHERAVRGARAAEEETWRSSSAGVWGRSSWSTRSTRLSPASTRGTRQSLSVRAAFPKLYALEEKYGGLIRGMVRGAGERKKRAEKAKDRARMFSFRTGMQTFPIALGRYLGDGLRLKCAATSVGRNDAPGSPPAFVVRYRGRGDGLARGPGRRAGGAGVHRGGFPPPVLGVPR